MPYYILGYLPEILVLLIFTFGIILIIWYLHSFYKDRAARQQKAEEQQTRYGEDIVLEWNAPRTPGNPDPEFGPLVIKIPKHDQLGAALFYETGVVIDKKRLPYSQIKDILLAPATTQKKHTLKQAVRDMGVLWIYPKKGPAIGLREMTYQFDNQIMENIKAGLGFSAYLTGDEQHP